MTNASIGPLVKALQFLENGALVASREAHAKSALRQLPPKYLRRALALTKDLRWLIEDVALEQVGTWSEEEVEEMRGQAARRKAQRMAEEEQ